MICDVDVVCRMTHSQDNPCSGTYSLLVPEDREDARPLRLVRVMGVALGKGTYRVRFERIADA